ncbi:MAG TPA: hypothetical protein VF156_15385 [Agromyces sp.]
MGRSRLHTAPTAVMLTAAQARAFLHVDHTSEDSEIADMIAAATGAVESWTRRALLTQVWEYTLDARGVARLGDDAAPLGRTILSGAAIALPRAPLRTIDLVQYTGTDDVAVTYSSTYYRADTSSDSRGRMLFREGAALPAVRDLASFTIRYTAGYGDDATAVPAQLRQAVRRMVAYLFENRGDVPDQPPSSVAALLSGYRRVRVR